MITPKEKEAVMAFLKTASPEDVTAFIETLVAQRPELRAELLEALKHLSRF